MGLPTSERLRFAPQDAKRTIADIIPFRTAFDRAPPVEGLIRPNPFKYEGMRAMVRYYVDITIAGKENLAKARELQKKGGKVLYMANHLSNSDGPVHNFVFDQQGVHRVAFVLGKRLMENPATKNLVNTVWTIPTWPPTEKPKNEAEEKQKNHMMLASRRAFRAALSNGFSVLIYPEGGRSYSGQMKDEVFPEIAGYLKGVDDLYIVTFGSMGTESVLPVGQAWPQHGKVILNFGDEPIEVASLISQYESLPKDDQNKAIMEDIMRRIAGNIDPAYRGRWG